MEGSDLNPPPQYVLNLEVLYVFDSQEIEAIFGMRPSTSEQVISAPHPNSEIAGIVLPNEEQVAGAMPQIDLTGVSMSDAMLPISLAEDNFQDDLPPFDLTEDTIPEVTPQIDPNKTRPSVIVHTSQFAPTGLPSTPPGVAVTCGSRAETTDKKRKIAWAQRNNSRHKTKATAKGRLQSKLKPISDGRLDDRLGHFDREEERVGRRMKWTKKN